MDLVLASGSKTRAAMLAAAGVPFVVEPPRVDEEAAKLALRAEGIGPRALADALAELKAVSVSRLRSGFVLGADQVLTLEGATFDKPPDLEAARAQLCALRGKTHELISAATIAVDGAPIWRAVETARLGVRNFSDAFLDRYLEAMGERATMSVGGYQIEGLGAQLFSRVEGDHFTILGLPLLPLLAFLREHRIVTP